MVYLLIIAFCFALALSRIVRCIVFHPVKNIYYCIKDLYWYILHKGWNIPVQIYYCIKDLYWYIPALM